MNLVRLKFQHHCCESLGFYESDAVDRRVAVAVCSSAALRCITVERILGSPPQVLNREPAVEPVWFPLRRV